jgi:hypothetical protein
MTEERKGYWYKWRQTFRSGPSKWNYEFALHDEEDMKELYGHRGFFDYLMELHKLSVCSESTSAEWDIVECPPLEWLKKKLKKVDRKLEFVKTEKEFLTNLITKSKSDPVT